MVRPSYSRGHQGKFSRLLGVLVFLSLVFGAAPAVGHDEQAKDLVVVPPGAGGAGLAPTASPLLVPGFSGVPGSVFFTYPDAPRRVDRDDAPGATEDLQFICPEPPLGLPIDPTSTGGDTVVYGCPIRIHDTSYSLGNTAIAVDHDTHQQVVFTSLHGGASDGRPYNHSRGGPRGQVHTGFASGDQGIQWRDQPPGPSQQPARNARGNDNDVVLDSAGLIYAAYLYHVEKGVDEWRSVAGLFKAGRPSDFDMGTSYDHPFWLETRDSGNHIERIDLMNLPGHVPVKELPLPENETAEAAGEDEFGETAVEYDFANATTERIVAIWHESAADPFNSTVGLSGYVDVAWTDLGGVNVWQRLDPSLLVGPCSAGSNGIHWEGRIYVACVVDKGYKDRNRARVGDIDLWEIDIHHNTSRLVGFTGLTTGGTVMLAQSMTEHNTYIGMLAWDQVKNDEEDLARLSIKTGYNWLSSLMRPGGRMTESALDLGHQLRSWGNGGEDLPLLDAHVTAFAMTDDTFQSILVYNEWHDDPQGLPNPDPTADPATPIRTRLTDYTKFFMAFNQCDGAVAGYQADLGTGVDQYNSDQYAQNPGIFNEPRDGLFKTRERETDEELLYFAIGDYGAVQYGAVVVNAMSSICTPPPIPPFIASAIAPQALTISSGVSSLMAAGFAVPATLMIGYMLTVKRRNAIYSTAEDDL